MLERGCITIDDLIIIAKHGVAECEKLNAQPYHFDVKIFVDYTEAATGDKFEKAISLIEVYEFIKNVTLSNCFNLMEKLAAEVAKGLMDKYQAIDEIHIRVRKTQFKVDCEVGGFGCEFVLKKEVAYLSLECGVGDRAKYLNEAVHYLRKIRGINVLKVSDFIEIDCGSLAGVVKIATYLEPEELLGHVLAVEQALIQTEGEVWDVDQFENDKICDIDIIFFGNKKIRTEKLTIPHRDLQNKDRLKRLLKSIEPNLEVL